MTHIYKSRVATVYLLGLFIDLINMFMASVAFPEIGQSLQASVGSVAWVANVIHAGPDLSDSGQYVACRPPWRQSGFRGIPGYFFRGRDRRRIRRQH
ncbi:hypothetical protein ACU4HD_11820 [Cupriavidus basilensis]